MTNFQKRFAISLLAMGSFTFALHAQSYYGGVRGTALDQNAGAVPNAKVTLINEGTGAQRSTLSTSAGEFIFSEGVPARYSLGIQAPGFKKFQRTRVVVGTQQQVALRLKLE